VKAVQISAFGDSAAVITPEGRLVYRIEFHESGPFDPPQLFDNPKFIACGDKFVPVLLDNGILTKVTAEDSVVLYAPSKFSTGGSHFLQLSAAASYIIA
jgi:hypothetical protein